MIPAVKLNLPDTRDAAPGLLHLLLAVFSPREAKVWAREVPPQRCLNISDKRSEEGESEGQLVGGGIASALCGCSEERPDFPQ